MIPAVEVNYLAVLVAAIVSMAIGYVWHGPLFGKQWMKLMGFNEKSMKSMKVTPTQAMIGGFVSMIVMAYVLAIFVSYTQAANFVEGMQTGFWLWLGFIATVVIGGVLWEGKPLKLFMINAGYWLVALLAMGGILAVWV